MPEPASCRAAPIPVATDKPSPTRLRGQRAQGSQAGLGCGTVEAEGVAGVEVFDGEGCGHGAAQGCFEEIAGFEIAGHESATVAVPGAGGILRRRREARNVAPEPAASVVDDRASLPL